MVKPNPSPKAQQHQLEGKEGRNSQYAQKMIERYEKTGITIPEAGLLRRINEGKGLLFENELRAHLDPTLAGRMVTVWVYNCAVCREPVEWPRRIGRGPAPRCDDCRKAARLATKRRTWHKHKERYRAGVGSIAPPVVEPVVERTPTRTAVDVPPGAALIWTPDD